MSAKPTLATIVSGQKSWDADVQDNFDKVVSAPLPVFEYDGDLTALQAAYPAASFRTCVCFAKPSGSWKLVYSDGATWAMV